MGVNNVCYSHLSIEKKELLKFPQAGIAAGLRGVKLRQTTICKKERRVTLYMSKVDFSDLKETACCSMRGEPLKCRSLVDFAGLRSPEKTDDFAVLHAHTASCAEGGEDS